MSTLLRTVAPLALIALLAPSTAFAGKVALTPLLMDASVNAKQRQAVYQLFSSELDFAPEVEGVAEMNTPPPTLDDACLAAVKCLAGIASANGAQSVVTGKMSVSGTNYLLDIVFFDGSKIARRKQYTVPLDATALANAMTPIVHEVLTGAGPKASPSVAAAAPRPTDLSGDDDLAIGGAALVDAVTPPVRAAVPPAPTKPAQPPAKPATGDRKTAAATAATAIAAGGATGAKPAPSDEELAQMINFGGSVSDISAEQLNNAAHAPAPAAPAPMVRPAPAPHVPDRDLQQEEEELSPHPIQDLDGPSRGGNKKPPAPHPPGGSGGGNELGHVVQITGRGGVTKYYKFNFISGGGEIGVAAFKGLHLIAGMEVYGVKRILPPEVQIQTGIYSQWNYIFPMNAGLIYKFPIGKAQPYVGADAIFVQYYKDELGADWAGGGRFRTGIDLMVIPNFGFNLNASVGAWTGANWGIIEQGVGTAGILPEVSAGTVFAF